VLVSIEHRLGCAWVRLQDADVRRDRQRDLAGGQLARAKVPSIRHVFDGHPDPRRLLMLARTGKLPPGFAVQIRWPPHGEKPQVTQEEFAANIERDQLTRRG
jgi:hypothetical protein